MIKYAVVTTDNNKVVDVIEVENTTTLDGYSLPDGACMLVYLNDTNYGDVVAGMDWDVINDKFV